MFILSIHDGHNASVALFQDGKLLYAIQEERLSRIKNHWGAPNLSLNHIIDKFNINEDNLSLVIFSGYQFTDRLQTTKDEYVQYTRKFLLKKPYSILSRFNYYSNKFIRSKFSYKLQEKRLKHYTHDLLIKAYAKKLCKFIEHHNCHLFTALAGYSKSKHLNGIAITLDGFGDGKCGSIFTIDNSLKLKQHITYQENLSFAKVYAWTTTYLGFTHLEHEYKLMGLSPYADPKYIRNLADALHLMFSIDDISINPGTCIGGKFTNDYKLFSYLSQIYQYQRFDVICGALQLWLEEIVSCLIKNIIAKFPANYIGLSGGLFMNVKLNQVIRNLLPEDVDLFVFPSCGDETNPIGAAYCEMAIQSQKQYRNNFDMAEREILVDVPTLDNMYLGCDSSSIRDEVLRVGHKSDSIYTFEQLSDINSTICSLLSQGEIVARVSGREELGARALGNRSLLSNSANLLSKDYLNDVIKSRDFWMPFAGSLCVENAHEVLYKYSDNYDPSYMIMTYDSIDSGSYICCTHPRDKTIRPQTVSIKSNPDYWDLLKKYESMTGHKVLLNTSLNLHGLPVAHCLDDLLLIFRESGLKYIAVDDLLLVKKI